MLCNKRIRGNFDGHNYCQLAAAHGLTVRQVRRIVDARRVAGQGPCTGAERVAAHERATSALPEHCESNVREELERPVFGAAADLGRRAPPSLKGLVPPWRHCLPAGDRSAIARHRRLVMQVHRGLLD